MLREGGARQRLEEVIRANEWRACDDQLLATRAGLPRAERVAARGQQLVAEGRIETLMVASTPVYIHVSHLVDMAAGAARRLKEHLAANPRLPGVPRGEWSAWMPRACPPKLRPALAEWLIAKGKVALADGYVVPLGHAGAMSPEDQRLFDAILAELEAARFQPPAIKSLTCVSAKNTKRARELMNLAVARGKLMYVAEGIWLHRSCWDELVGLVTSAIRERGGVTVADIRTMLNSSRKYVVPIAEALDSAGVTKRVGDNRVLGPRAEGDG
jgi:selenocysteine-specific elongation factor